MTKTKPSVSPKTPDACLKVIADEDLWKAFQELWGMDHYPTEADILDFLEENFHEAGICGRLIADLRGSN